LSIATILWSNISDAHDAVNLGRERPMKPVVNPKAKQDSDLFIV
jgi:hypothetical protein